jgi:hypothetical protein
MPEHDTDSHDALLDPVGYLLIEAASGTVPNDLPTALGSLEFPLLRVTRRR